MIHFEKPQGIEQSVQMENIMREQKESKFLATMTKRPGMNLFSFNIDTFILAQIEPKVELIATHQNGVTEAIKKLSVYETSRSIYFQVLNMKTAEKRVFKFLHEGKTLFNLKHFNENKNLLGIK